MSILNKLADALGQRDEAPNIVLAETIVATRDKKSINELVEHLGNKKTGIQNDCIKVLYEIGTRKPELIAPHLQIFLGLLHHKNNRLQWGAMTALQTISTIEQGKIHNVIPVLTDAAEKGSVITRDQYIRILVNLCSSTEYSGDAFTLLLDQLKRCPVNQLPMYAEFALPVSEKYGTPLKKVLSLRLQDLEKESQRKRIEKVIKKIH